MLEVMELMQMSPDHNVVQVLIVDDQASYRRAARSVVELTPGFVVAGEAYTGEAAVDAARGKMPDLVLMDVHLPGIEGWKRADGSWRPAMPNGRGSFCFRPTTRPSMLRSRLSAERGRVLVLVRSGHGDQPGRPTRR
jgi:hypothetical protein